MDFNQGDVMKAIDNIVNIINTQCNVKNISRYELRKIILEFINKHKDFSSLSTIEKEGLVTFILNKLKPSGRKIVIEQVYLNKEYGFARSDKGDMFAIYEVDENENMIGECESVAINGQITQAVLKVLNN